MGTPKRERQKAGRQARLQELQAQQRKAQTRRTTTRVAAIIVGFVVLAVILAFVFKSNDSKSTSTTATIPGTTIAGATGTTVAVSTAPTLPSPSTVPGQKINGDTSCPAADGSSARTISFAKAPPTCIDATKTYKATFETNKGTFTAVLDAKKAPITVNNFVVLARYHYFDGIVFHRIIPGFVVQGGDPTGSGSGGPGYSFKDELPAKGDYQLGSLAMANSGPDTNGSQFFIITGDQGVALPPSYSLFGKVDTGFDTSVKALEAAGQASGAPTASVYMTKVTIAES